MRSTVAASVISPDYERHMFNWFASFRRVMRQESGSSSLQHAALLALVVSVSIGGVRTFGAVVQDYFQKSESSFSLMGSDQAPAITSERVRGRRLSQNVPQMSLKERLELAEQRKAQRIAALRERAAHRQC